MAISTVGEHVHILRPSNPIPRVYRYLYMLTIRILFMALSIKLKFNCPSAGEKEIIVVYSHNRKLRTMRMNKLYLL